MSAVIFYGAYSYFSAVVIYDIYAYELFNVFFAALPIMIYALFDQEYTYEESMRYPDLYEAGPNNKYFNQIVYHKTILVGIGYGFVSVVAIFMVLESGMIDGEGRVGYFYQSGAVLFFNIILVVNIKILIMSSGLSLGLFISVMISFVNYWLVYFLQSRLFDDFMLVDSIKQEWTTIAILLLHLVMISALSGVELVWDRY